MDMILIMAVIGDMIRFIIPLTIILLFTIIAGIHRFISILTTDTDGIAITMAGTITAMDIITAIIQAIIRVTIPDTLLLTGEAMTVTMALILTEEGIIQADFQEMTITGLR
jgi:hypothetical protein